MRNLSIQEIDQVSGGLGIELGVLGIEVLELEVEGLGEVLGPVFNLVGGTLGAVFGLVGGLVGGLFGVLGGIRG